MPSTAGLPPGADGFSVDVVNLRRRGVALDSANDTSGATLRANITQLLNARGAWQGTTKPAFDSVWEHFERADAALATKLTNLAINLETAARSYDRHEARASNALNL